MIKFYSYQGIVRSIDDYHTGENDGCYKIFALEDSSGGIVNFIISPSTFFVDQLIVQPGDRVTGFYDGNAPVPLIYPPQYQALAIAKEVPYQNVKADYFNSHLVSSDGSLKLNLSPSTLILLKNGQPFSKLPINRNLIVLYGPATKSIPAQTTPFRIIVWC